MKKLSIILTVLFLTLSVLFASCDNGDANQAGGDNDTEKESVSDNAHVHTYGQWVTLTEATCQQTGNRVRVCSCGDQQTETVEKLQCNYVNNVCSMCHNEKPTAFVPDYSKGEENAVGSDNASLNYTAQADYIYYSNGNKLEKVKKNGTAHKPVYTAPSGELLNVNAVGDWIYFYCKENTTDRSYIAKVRTDGTGFEKLVSSVNVWEMLAVNDKLYYTTVTENWEYVEYGKEIFPLYSISVNGGTPTQLRDGAVSYLVADATYLYFSHTTKEGENTVCRIRHSNARFDVLLQNTATLNLSLENEKLYFFVEDIYDPENVSLASISIKGGSYTTYGKMNCDPSLFHVIGNKAYFVGSAPFSEENPEPEYGLTEYNMSTKKFKLLSEGECDGFVGVFDLLICPTYDHELEKLDSIVIYTPSTGASKKIKVS